ncbi:hypothetical protein ACFOY4_10350 [Actinomadura syzygii]|uniref:Uncharacterized protein n=1 Tax=Actinomadura syzygii TaxID=1427538 RepID=A0A5D0UDE2_9ACTN|nr:hypothetical protein [Actinomadura syzygii]TYC15796.1 hypothetical protein FXF65_10615 [Actinomadura syzygii]
MRSGTVTVGLVLAGLLGLADLATAGAPDVPAPAIVIAIVLGLATLAALVPAWRRGNRRVVFAVAATRALSALAAVPGLTTQDTSGTTKGIIVAALAVTILAIALLAPALRRTSIPS